MAERFRPTNHGDEHRPVGWNGPTDPGGPDPLTWLTPTAVVRPWFRQKLPFIGGSAPLTFPDGVETTLQFDSSEFGDGGDTYFAAITGPDRFNVLVGGWVEMYGEVLLDDTFDSWVEIQMHDGGSFPLKQTFWNNTPQSLPTLAFHWVQRMEAGAVEFKLAHGAATDQAIDAAYVEFVYLGAYTGTNPHDSNPDF